MTTSNSIPQVRDGAARGRTAVDRVRVWGPATVALLMFYAFLAPLGNLVRFGSGDAEMGVPTIVLALVIAMNVIPALTVSLQNRVLRTLVILGCWMAVSSALADNLREAYSQVAGYFVYVGAAGVSLGVEWTSQRVRRLVFIVLLGSLVSSVFTVVDWFGIVKIPGVNELSISTRTELGYVMQASGVFARRSAMAAYYALLIPIGVLCAIYVKELSRRTRALYLTTAATCVLSLILTHNRAGVLGAFVAIAAVVMLLSRSPGRLARVLLLGAVILVTIVWMVAEYLPDQFSVYLALFDTGGVASADQFHDESDQLRIVFLKRALSAMLHNPVGRGYTMITGVPGFGRMDPHNMFVQIIWAAGAFGLVWLIYFAWLIFRQTRVLFRRQHERNPSAQYGVAIVGGLLGWLVCGMAHTIISTGVSWVLLGVVLRLTRRIHVEAHDQTVGR